MGRLSNGSIRGHYVPSDPLPKSGVEMFPFQTWAKQIHEFINRADLRTHWLAMSEATNNRTAKSQSPKLVNANRAEYMRSSGGMITIVVMAMSNFIAVGVLYFISDRWMSHSHKHNHPRRQITYDESFDEREYRGTIFRRNAKAFPPYAIGLGGVRSFVRSLVMQISWWCAVFAFAAQTCTRTTKQ